VWREKGRVEGNDQCLGMLRLRRLRRNKKRRSRMTPAL
jgi:hypothetical protein